MLHRLPFAVANRLVATFRNLYNKRLMAPGFLDLPDEILLEIVAMTFECNFGWMDCLPEFIDPSQNWYKPPKPIVNVLENNGGGRAESSDMFQNSIAQAVHPGETAPTLFTCRRLLNITVEAFHNQYSFRFSSPWALCEFSELVYAQGLLRSVYRVELILNIMNNGDYGSSWIETGQAWIDLFEAWAEDDEEKIFPMMPFYFPALKELRVSIPFQKNRWGSSFADQQQYLPELTKVWDALVSTVRAPKVTLDIDQADGFGSWGDARQLMWNPPPPNSDKGQQKTEAVDGSGWAGEQETENAGAGEPGTSEDNGTDTEQIPW